MKGPSPPPRIGPYVALEVVASRAFSVTYRARHEELGRVVLLKTLKPSLSMSSPFARTLEREAKILAGLRHEAFFTLLEVGRRDDTLWLALEDARGAALSEVLERAGSLAVEPALAMMIDISLGVAHAHERGVVLRELSPESITLTKEGGVKIAEVGTAEAARLPALPEVIEGEGALAPPEGMAPEQILGEAVTARTDIFSLGVLLYRALAGKGPFEAPGGDRKETARRIRKGAAEPLRAAAPIVSRELERVVMRCLARAPGDRFESARALAAALTEVLEERTRAPRAVLISRALAAAKLGEELPLPGGGAALGEPASAEAPLWPALRVYLGLFALVVVGALVIELGVRDRSGTPEGGGEAIGSSSERGYVRALATPWAEVLIDGEVIDTTPIGRPIAVSPGRHFITFRHPNAPEEKRTVVVAAGQTVVVDVTLRIDRGAREDAGAGAKADADISP